MENQHYLPLPTRTKKVEKINYSDILYLEGDINYTLIHLRNGKTKVSPRTLAFHITHSLNDSFIRIHRAFCVNKSFIQTYNPKNDGNFLLLEGGIQLSISRRKKKALHGIAC